MTDFRESVPFLEIEFAATKSFDRCRIGELRLHFGRFDPGKLFEEIESPSSHWLAQVVIHIGKVKKRRGGAELLPLKEEWCPGREQKQRRHRAIAPRRGEEMRPRAVDRVCDLVMVFKKGDEAFRR